ncbi:hypothetical protein AAVH_18078, partial [Aphelenchoides avenae]
MLYNTIQSFAKRFMWMTMGTFSLKTLLLLTLFVRGTIQGLCRDQVYATIFVNGDEEYIPQPLRICTRDEAPVGTYPWGVNLGRWESCQQHPV